MSSSSTPILTPTPVPVPSLVAPSNLIASNQDGKVVLSWTGATGGSGGLSYSLDSSIDNATWQPVAKGLLDPTYTDTAVSYKQHYYYRVQAIDSSGDRSDYATTDIVTASFNANNSNTHDLTLSSSTGDLTVYLPAGATDQDVQCSLADSPIILSSLPTSYLLLDGPYQLLCKQADGTAIDHLAKAANMTFSVSSQNRAHYSSIGLFVQNDSKWQHQKLKLDKKGQFHFSTQQLNNLVVLGKTKKSYTWTLVLFIPVIMSIGLYFAVKRLSNRRNLQKYSDYVHKSRGF